MIEIVPKEEIRRYCRPMDVVRWSGLSKSRVMAALWSGELKGFRLGRAWMIPVDEIDRWIRGSADEHAA